MNSCGCEGKYMYVAKYRLMVAIWVNYEQACDMKTVMYTS